MQLFYVRSEKRADGTIKETEVMANSRKDAQSKCTQFFAPLKYIQLQTRKH